MTNQKYPSRALKKNIARDKEVIGLKRLTAWVLSLCVLLGMAACGRQAEKPVATSGIS